MRMQPFVVRPALLLAAALSLAPVVDAASSLRTPAPGSRERKAILGALRKPVVKMNRKAFIFTGVNMKVSGNWAYVDAQTVDARNNAVGPDFTNELAALLRRSGRNWRVVEWAYATDVISMGWEEKHRSVPRKLWPHRR